MRLFAYFLTAFLFISHEGCYCDEYTIGDIFDEIGGAIGGGFKNLPKVPPSFTEICDLSKDALIGYPYEVVYETVDRICE